MPPEHISEILAALGNLATQSGRLEERLTGAVSTMARIESRLDDVCKDKVDRTECAALHAQNRAAVESLRREASAQREASQPAISLDAAIEARQERSRKALTFWLTTALAVTSLLGGAYVITSKVQQLTTHVEQKTSRDEAYRSELRKELLQLVKQPAR